ncbi:MAG: TIGR02996 domain-containing protein [Archangium sp.]|nr:TIGR02996 domain-containing protein [Archangium sp.]
MTEADLLAAIARTPAAEEPRLVYADLLAERGDPRGELMHLQLKLAKQEDAAVRRRERALIEQHHERLLGTPFSPDITWSFDRGFPTGRFAHAGVFVTVRNGLFGCLRCFADGTAIKVSIGGAFGLSSLERVVQWFVRGYHDSGPYEVALGDHASPAFTSTITSSAGSVEYRGIISGRVITLDWKSHINGATGQDRFELMGTQLCDGRLP